jgi:membrane-anchored mycosin MYCP
MAKNRTGTPEHRNDIVVSLTHRDLVLEELDKLVKLGLLASSPSPGQANEVLGLGLVPLDLPPDVVAAQAVGDGAAEVDVDVVLTMVRESCAYRYRGWVPTMAKNRVLSGFGGEGGHISGGGPHISGGGPHISGGGPHISGGGGGLPSIPNAGPPKPHGSRGEGARLAIIDTPLYRDTPGGRHLDFVGKYFAKKEPMPADSGHSTFVLGLVEAVAPGAAVELRGILDKYALAEAWTVACAMAEYVDSEPDVLSLSLGCYTVDNQPPLLLQRAVDVLSAHTLIVAAAGNHRQPHYPRPFWPAALDAVVAVGARDHHDELASFSPRAPWVDITAPGVGLISTYLDGEVRLGKNEVADFPGYAQWRGTSFATATAAAQIAAHMTPERPAGKALEHIVALPHGKSPIRGYKYQ